MHLEEHTNLIDRRDPQAPAAPAMTGGEIKDYTDNDYDAVRAYLERTGEFDQRIYGREAMRLKTPGSIKLAIKDGELLGCIVTCCDGVDCWITHFSFRRDALETDVPLKLVDAAEALLHEFGMDRVLIPLSQQLSAQRAFMQRLGFQETPDGFGMFRDISRQ